MSDRHTLTGQQDEFSVVASAGVIWVEGIDAQWVNNNQPADVVVMTCTKCGWELEMRAGDPPIPHGDPRLTCPHGPTLSPRKSPDE